MNGLEVLNLGKWLPRPYSPGEAVAEPDPGAPPRERFRERVAGVLREPGLLPAGLELRSVRVAAGSRTPGFGEDESEPAYWVALISADYRGEGWRGSLWSHAKWIDDPGFAGDFRDQFLASLGPVRRRRIAKECLRVDARNFVTWSRFVEAVKAGFGEPDGATTEEVWDAMNMTIAEAFGADREDIMGDTDDDPTAAPGR